MDQNPVLIIHSPYVRFGVWGLTWSESEDLGFLFNGSLTLWRKASEKVLRRSRGRGAILPQTTQNG